MGSQIPVRVCEGGKDVGFLKRAEGAVLLDVPFLSASKTFSVCNSSPSFFGANRGIWTRAGGI